MILFSVTLIALFVVAMTISRLRSSSVVRVGFATALLGTQLFILAVSFDAVGRTVMSAQDRVGTPLADFEDGVRSLRDALHPYRVSLALMSIGLFILVATASRNSSKID